MADLADRRVLPTTEVRHVPPGPNGDFSRNPNRGVRWAAPGAFDLAGGVTACDRSTIRKLKRRPGDAGDDA